MSEVLIALLVAALAGIGLWIRGVAPPKPPPTADAAPHPRLHQAARPQTAPRPADVEEERPPLGAPVADIEYADAMGEVTRRRITIIKLQRDYDIWPQWVPRGMRAWCHMRNAPRTFLFERVLALVDAADGTRYAGGEVAATWAQALMHEPPHMPIPESPPGRLSTRRPSPPISATVQWQRTPGDVEMFDVEIDEVELAGGVPFAFSGRAKRRRSATDRAWTGRRRFKLRGWDTPEAPIDALFPPESNTKLRAPHRWLAEQTGGGR